MKIFNNILKQKLFLIIFLCINCTQIAWGQFYVPKITKITDEKGLTPAATFAIVQDYLGFIWFGTVDGLYRYDGYNFKIFRNQKNNANSLSNNTIRSLCLGKDHKLWIATQGGGVDCFDLQTENFINYSAKSKSVNQLSGNSVWTIIEDKNGDIWMGVDGNGIDKLDIKTKKFTHYNIIKGDLSDTYEIRSLFQDNKGMIWIGNGSYGAFVLNPKTGSVKNYQHNPDDPNSLSGNGVFSIYQDKLGRLWIGTYGKGLNLFDYQTETFKHIKNNPQTSNSLISDLIYHISEKPGGGLWISTEFGLSYMDKNLSDFVNFTSNNIDVNSLSDKRIRTTFVDNQGILWIGTEIGVDKLIEQNRFLLYKNLPSNPNSLENGIVRSILEDDEDNLWIGLIDKGLTRYNRKTNVYKSFKFDPNNPNSISGNHITALFQDSNMDIWIGEWDKGLLKYNRKTGGFDKIANNYSLNNRLTDNRIQSIKEERPGVLWIGTEGGVNRFEIKTGKVTYFTHNPKNSNSLNANGVQSNAFIVDSDGNLWVGLWSSGFNKIEFLDSGHEKANFKSWKNDLKDKNSLNNNNVISLYMDKSKILWIGTYGGGLNKFDTKTGTFSHFTTDEGLPDNIIYSILEDNNQMLWLSTDKGISKFNPQTKTFQNFDHTDGLQDDHFFWGSSFKSRKGELFFGGINGLNSFYPENVKINRIHATPVVLSIKVFDKPIDYKNNVTEIKELNLSYNQNFLTFEFSGLDYIEPEKNSFQYKLDGVDQSWNLTGNRRYANYTNLSARSYVFHLKVANSEGEWSPNELTIKINIKPPWWDTIWSKTFLLLSIVGAILFFYYLRVGMLEKQKHRLEEQVAKRTNEISEKNIALEQKNEEILEQKEELSEQTKSLNEKNRLLKKTLSELELTQKALIQSEKMASLGILSAGIAHEINNPLNFISLSIDNLKEEIEEIIDFDAKIGSPKYDLIIKLLNHAQTGTDRISKIVNSLRLYSNSKESTMQVCNLNDLIQNSITIIHSKIPDYINLEFDLNEIKPVKCRPVQINQVLINIIDNAIHAISEKSEKKDEKIKISTGIEIKSNFNYAAILISNTGPELSKGLLKHIFEPFYTTKAPNKGIGLGLYISYDIIKEHGGFLYAENKDNFVIFKILIPL